MSDKPSSIPAFPTDDYYDEKRYGQTEGMTLRDYFAAKAMAGSLSGVPGPHLVPETLARESYAHADAMMKEREK